MALRRISGLWLKDGKKGKFMYGKVQEDIPAGTRLLAFKNQGRLGNADPDYTLHVADDDEDQRGTSRSAGGQPSHNDQRDALNSFEVARREAAGQGDRVPF
jgi:hypothetical protein